MTLAYRNEGPITLTSGEALAEARLVKLSAGKAVYADAGDEPIGITAEAVENNKPVAIYPLKGNIERVTAAGAISAGSAIFAANDGKVSDAAVGKQIGINLQAASADTGKVAAQVWGPRGGNDMLSAKSSLCELFDDFLEFHTVAPTGQWNVAVADAGASGTTGMTDAANGVVQVYCDGDDNDEAYVSSVAESWKFQTAKRLYFETKIKLTEANTDDANWIIGLSDTVAANSLLDNGGGPMASYDGAVFFKVDGTMKIQFETSNAGTQVTNATLADFASATEYTLGFFYDPNDGTTAKVTPFINGAAGTTHNLTISGLEEMHILFGVKAGGANEEALLVDYVHVTTER